MKDSVKFYLRVRSRHGFPGERKRSDWIHGAETNVDMVEFFHGRLIICKRYEQTHVAQPGDTSTLMSR